MKKVVTAFVCCALLASSSANAGFFRKMVKRAVVGGAVAVTVKTVHSKMQKNNQEPTIGASLPAASKIPAMVVGVSDGDTVIVQSDYGRSTIRLRAIDAPETTCHDITANDLNYCQERYQRFGKDAKAALASLVMRRSVVVVTGKQSESHGRAVGNILLNGRDVNLEMVRQGLAWHEPKLTPDETLKEKVLYSAAMLKARKQKIGLWSDSNPVRPATFRKEVRS